MYPRFRSDLKASREEQQGVVFYRIDDPASQTTFRLYEIEYLIATKLDGALDPDGVIDAVKHEYNFDITGPDLEKFVQQLDGMGFIDRSAGGGNGAGTEGGGEVSPYAETAVMQRPTAGTDGSGARIRVQTTPQTDQTIRMAVRFLREGDVSSARERLRTAMKAAPGDVGIERLLTQLDLTGEDPSGQELRAALDVAREVFPAIVTGTDAEGWDVDDDLLGPPEDVRTRVLWTVILVVVLVVGTGGLYWLVKAGRVFESAVEVSAATITNERLPIYHEAPAAKIEAIREATLAFADPGKVEWLAAEGDTVKAGDAVARLVLPKAAKKQIAKAQTALKKAEVAHTAAVKKLGKAQEQREALEAERDQAEADLKTMKPKTVMRRGGVSKRDIEKRKRIIVKNNKKLSKLAKKFRKPMAAEAKAKAKVQAAAKALAQVEAKHGGKILKAPFDGVVAKVLVKPAATVAAGAKAVLVRDPSGAQLTFHVDSAGGLQAGGEAHVSVGRGPPTPAKVVSVKEGEKKKGRRLVVNLVDPAGAFVEMEPKEFRLVREFVETAFSVDTSAVVDREGGGSVVFIVAQGRAMAREVKVLAKDPDKAIVEDPSAKLKGGDQVVVANPDGGGVGSLLDGAPVTVRP